MLSKFVLILLIVAIPVSVFLIGQRTGFFSKASVSSIPKQIRITNISDNSFSVSWVTDKEALGFVSFGEKEKLGNSASDDRDNGVQKARFTHHITLKNLDPDKTYFFKINLNGNVYQQKTAPATSDTPPLAQPVFGSVLTKDGKVPKEALIYLTTEGGTPLSTFTREGNWLITVNNARSKDLSVYIFYKKGDNIKIQAVSGEGSSLISTEIDFTKPIRPIKLLDTN